MHDEVKATIVVPVFQEAAILDLFLESLWRTVDVPSRLFLINDGCSGDAAAVLRRWVDQSHSYLCPELITHDVPLGAARSRNEALRKLEGEIVFFVDSDVVLTPGWQTDFIETLNTAPNIAAVGAVLVYPQTGGIQHCGIAFTEDIGRHLYLNARPDVLPTDPYPVQAVVSALCTFRRDAIERAGSMDETFFNGYEDFDHILRIRELGGEVLVQPKIRAYHWELSSGPHRPLNQKRNLGRFWRLWGGAIRPDFARFLHRRLDCLSGDRAPLRVSGIDLSSDRGDAPGFWSAMRESSRLEIERVTDLSFLLTLQPAVWLPRVLGRDGHLSRDRYLFFVDNFVCLLGNDYWLGLRQAVRDDDVVVDLYSNALFLRDLRLQMWPGGKVR